MGDETDQSQPDVGGGAPAAGVRSKRWAFWTAEDKAPPELPDFDMDKPDVLQRYLLSPSFFKAPASNIALVLGLALWGIAFCCVVRHVWFEPDGTLSWPLIGCYLGILFVGAAVASLFSAVNYHRLRAKFFWYRGAELDEVTKKENWEQIRQRFTSFPSWEQVKVFRSGADAGDDAKGKNRDLFLAWMFGRDVDSEPVAKNFGGPMFILGIGISVWFGWWFGVWCADPLGLPAVWPAFLKECFAAWAGFLGAIGFVVFALFHIWVTGSFVKCVGRSLRGRVGFKGVTSTALQPNDHNDLRILEQRAEYDLLVRKVDSYVIEGALLAGLALASFFAIMASDVYPNVIRPAIQYVDWSFEGASSRVDDDAAVTEPNAAPADSAPPLAPEDASDAASDDAPEDASDEVSEDALGEAPEEALVPGACVEPTIDPAVFSELQQKSRLARAWQIISWGVLPRDAQSGSNDGAFMALLVDHCPAMEGQSTGRIPYSYGDKAIKLFPTTLGLLMVAVIFVCILLLRLPFNMVVGRGQSKLHMAEKMDVKEEQTLGEIRRTVPITVNLGGTDGGDAGAGGASAGAGADDPGKVTADDIEKKETERYLEAILGARWRTIFDIWNQDQSLFRDYDRYRLNLIENLKIASDQYHKLDFLCGIMVVLRLVGLSTASGVLVIGGGYFEFGVSLAVIALLGLVFFAGLLLHWGAAIVQAGEKGDDWATGRLARWSRDAEFRAIEMDVQQRQDRKSEAKRHDETAGEAPVLSHILVREPGFLTRAKHWRDLVFFKELAWWTIPTGAVFGVGVAVHWVDGEAGLWLILLAWLGGGLVASGVTVAVLRSVLRLIQRRSK